MMIANGYIKFSPNKIVTSSFIGPSEEITFSLKMNEMVDITPSLEIIGRNMGGKTITYIFTKTKNND